MKLTIGKRQGLQRLSTEEGLFNIIAIDHRDVYVEMLQLRKEKKVELDDVVDSKLNIIRSVIPLASGILMDPIYCAHQSIIRNIIPKDFGFMVSIEGNDYSTKEFNSANYLMEGIDVESIKRMGASCVKFFIYYNPLSDICFKQEELIQKVAEDCKKSDILFLLEPILYSLDDKKFSINEKVQLTYEMLRRFKNIGVDIFKIDFPGDIEKLNEEENLKICKNVSSIIETPWIILSSGIELESLKQQIKIACKGGASGIAIGRTLWGEYLLDNSKENCQIMKSIMAEISEIISTYGRDWRDIC